MFLLITCTVFSVPSPVNDTLDEIFDESGDEEESQDIVNQVLDEIGIEITGKVSENPSSVSPKPATYGQCCSYLTPPAQLMTEGLKYPKSCILLLARMVTAGAGSWFGCERWCRVPRAGPVDTSRLHGDVWGVTAAVNLVFLPAALIRSAAAITAGSRVPIPPTGTVFPVAPEYAG